MRSAIHMENKWFPKTKVTGMNTTTGCKSNQSGICQLKVSQCDPRKSGCKICIYQRNQQTGIFNHKITHCTKGFTGSYFYANVLVYRSLILWKVTENKHFKESKASQITVSVNMIFPWRTPSCHSDLSFTSLQRYLSCPPSSVATWHSPYLITSF